MSNKNNKYDDKSKNKNNRNQSRNGNNSSGTGKEDSTIKNSSEGSAMSGMIKDATSIPFNWASGMRVPLGDGYSTDSYPQMMGLYYQPTLGISTSNESPIFVASKEAWQTANVNNGRVPQYDPVDLGMYFYAAGNLEIAFAICRKIYALCWYYNGENRSVPNMWFDMLHIDFDSISEDLENFRTNINLRIRKVNKTFSIPDGLEFVSRQKRMIESIFTDEESLKTQLYMFHPVCLYKWDEGSIDPETQEAIPTRLVPVPWFDVLTEHGETIDPYSQPQVYPAASTIWTPRTNLYDAKAIYAWLDSFIDPLIGSTDIDRMISDLQNANTSMHIIDSISEEEEITISKDDSMLMMIENLRIARQARMSTKISGANKYRYIGHYYPAITVNNDINAGYPIFTYRTSAYRKDTEDWLTPLLSFQRRVLQNWVAGKTINMHTDNPSTEEQYLATRWVPHLSYTPQENSGDYPDGEMDVVSCSTELIVDAVIYWRRYSSANMAHPATSRTVWIHVPPMLFNEPTGTENEFTTFGEPEARTLAYLSVFHRHFEMAYTPYDYNNTEFQDMGIASMMTPYWELDKWGYFQNTSLDKCHNISVLVAFNTSLNKKFNTSSSR